MAKFGLKDWLQNIEKKYDLAGYNQKHDSIIFKIIILFEMKLKNKVSEYSKLCFLIQNKDFN